MSEQFGEDKFYNQPLKLREEIHTGRLKIKQAHGQALPVKQHSKCNMAVGMAWTFVTTALSQFLECLWPAAQNGHPGVNMP